MFITGITASLASLFLVALTLRVISGRQALRVGLGDGGDEPLRQKIRAHANFVEYTPIFLILLGLAEYQVGSPIGWRVSPQFS